MRYPILSAVLCVAVVAIPIAPVEHVHKTTGSDGHDHLVAHSHSENHHHHIDADHHNDDVSIDDDDSVVLTIDLVFAVPVSYELSAPILSQVALLEEPPIAPYARPAEFVERVIHGPPRAPTVVRGPPVPALL